MNSSSLLRTVPSPSSRSKTPPPPENSASISTHRYINSEPAPQASSTSSYHTLSTGPIPPSFSKTQQTFFKQELTFAHLNNTSFHAVAHHAPSHPPAFSHTMIAALGKQAIPALEAAITQTLFDAVIWHSPLITGSDSLVSLVQIYYDKFSISLRTFFCHLLPPSHYPTHLLRHLATNPPLQQPHRCWLRINLLPIHFSYPRRQLHSPDLSKHRLQIRNEARPACHLHHRPAHPLLQSHHLPSREAHSVFRHRHSVTSRYCARIPKAKDVLAVLDETPFKLLCHRCKVSRSDLHFPCPTFTRRTQNQTITAQQPHSALLHDSQQGYFARKTILARTMRQQASKAFQDLSLSKYFSIHLLLNFIPHL